MGGQFVPGTFFYILEFKMNDAQKAMARIHEKRYYERYKIKEKQIILVGISFSKEKRNLGQWIVEEYTG
ncbi:MAG: PD-(D/E)XK nuclease domain-containing protein [Candidatus Aminicenantes bacterium]|nr:MAG: PD-(D/E)XK nuclease domain-containing protein [Candidatus Aminicenantes bacterium]